MRQNLLLVYFRLKKVGKRWGGCCQEALLTQWSPRRLQFFSEGLDRGVQICTEYSFLHSSEEKNNDKQTVPLFSRLDHGSDLNRVLGTSCNTPLSIHTPTSLLLLHIYTPATTHLCQSTPQPLFFCSIYISSCSPILLSSPLSRTEAMLVVRVISLKSQLGISALNPPGKQLSSLKRSLIPKMLTDHKDQTQSSP